MLTKVFFLHHIDDGTARGAGIDSNDNFDPDGIEFDITSLNAVIFDTAITTLRVSFRDGTFSA